MSQLNAPAREHPSPESKKATVVSRRQRHTVLRAFEILKAFQYPGEWVRGCDLSRRAGIPEATVYSLMITLEAVGAVIRDDHGQYQCALLSMAQFNAALFNNQRIDPANGYREPDASAHYSSAS